MAVTVSVLASGSRGNCALVSSTSTRILVDAGLSGRETFKRLRGSRRSEKRVEDISAILITHEHSDHVAGLERLATKLNVPVYLTEGTHCAWNRAVRDGVAGGTRGVRAAKLARTTASSRRCPSPSISTPAAASASATSRFMPFTIPHDAADPVGFTFRAEGIKIGFATDLGYMPVSVRNHLRGRAS